MPTNKNALVRFAYLDAMLSNRHHYYTMGEIVELCNRRLMDNGFKKVSRRCLEKDIEFLEYAPFYADIERFRVDGKTCLRYKNPSYSIFKKELTEEERSLLREMLGTLGQFEGLENFKWLDSLKKSLGIERYRRVISFSHNLYLQNSNLLGTLFDAISNEVVIRLSYHTFADKFVRSIDLHPYLLKQYNDRWFLLGAAHKDKKILTFALDRIDKVEPLPAEKFVRCPDDFEERFEDIVGVTYNEERPIEHILFWVSDISKDYVITKPLHASQTLYKGAGGEQLRQRYPMLHGGAFFSIDCICNYELIRLLSSFGPELLVLQSESGIEKTIYQKICAMKEKYDNLRT